MRILMVSNSVLSKNDSTGKVLSEYFKLWDPKNLAQLYFQEQMPELSVIGNYFRIADGDILKSAATPKNGTRSGADETSVRDENREEGFMPGSKTILKNAAHDTARRPENWDTPALESWIDQFDPELVFLAADPYPFVYDAAIQISRSRKLPMILFCAEDFYLSSPDRDTAVGQNSSEELMHCAKRAMDHASLVACTCEKMADKYKEIFHVPSCAMHTLASFSQPLHGEKKTQISYIGTLENHRAQQLVRIGKTLKNMNLPEGPHWLTVYSDDLSKEFISWMTRENGIDFRGKISDEEAMKVMAESLAMVHTDAFDDESRNRFRYSISAELGNLLMSGTCIFAFGPRDTASMEYLKEHQAAVCAVSEEELEEKLTQLIENSNLRKQTEENALQLAGQNHSVQSLLAILGSMEKSLTSGK